jgi:hypothetical protein
LAENEYNSKLRLKLCDADKAGSRKWWNLLKYFLGRKSNSGIGPIEYKNSIIYDDLDKADAFNEYFASHSNLDSSNVTLPPIGQESETTLSYIKVTRQDIIDVC